MTTLFRISIGAAVLSHHVGTFALVSAFFLFAVGCVNVLLGLAFRGSIKTKRSLTSWRERLNTPSLPRSAADFRAGGSAAGVLNVGGNVFTHMTGSTNMSEKAGGEHPGFGFGRQGEKHAGLKGFLISKPVESLPRYVPKPSTARPRGSGIDRSSSRASSRDSRDSRDSVDDLGTTTKPNRI